MKIKSCLKTITNNDKDLIIEEYCPFTKAVSQIAVKKAELINQYIYKNLDTTTLKAMKFRIEDELYQRELKKGGKQ